MKLEISLVLLNQKLRCLTKRTYLTDKARMWKRIGGGQIKNSNNSGFKEIIQRKNVRISDFKSEHTSVTGTRADEETIDRLIEIGDNEQIFQKAIREQGRGQVGLLLRLFSFGYLQFHSLLTFFIFSYGEIYLL
ncbi:uncharacterized protein [Primulina huaijiensis]|uniref:uncharacterized protein isoform X1 n=1 Tax=Primulina huaijiensis TaxID=1492673 RepID=UPI003CC6FCBA